MRDKSPFFINPESSIAVSSVSPLGDFFIASVESMINRLNSNHTYIYEIAVERGDKQTGGSAVSVQGV